MIRRSVLPTLCAVALLVSVLHAAPLRSFGEFKDLSIIFEVNETDEDAEVVTLAKAFEGMDQFRVTTATRSSTSRPTIARTSVRPRSSSRVPPTRKWTPTRR